MPIPTTDKDERHGPFGPPIRKEPPKPQEWVPTGNGSIQRNTRDGTMRNVPAPPPAQKLRPKTIGDYDMLDADLGYTVQPKSKEMRDLPVYKPAAPVTYTTTLENFCELFSIAAAAPAEYRVGGYTLELKADHD